MFTASIILTAGLAILPAGSSVNIPGSGDILVPVGHITTSADRNVGSPRSLNLWSGDIPVPVRRITISADRNVGSPRSLSSQICLKQAGEKSTSANENVFRRWVLPALITAGAGAVVYTLYSVRGR